MVWLQGSPRRSSTHGPGRTATAAERGLSDAENGNGEKGGRGRAQREGEEVRKRWRDESGGRVRVCVCVHSKSHTRFNLEEPSSPFFTAMRNYTKARQKPHKRFPIASASLAKLAPVPAAWALQARGLIRGGFSCATKDINHRRAFWFTRGPETKKLQVRKSNYSFFRGCHLG